jgi:hypothetical protein
VITTWELNRDGIVVNAMPSMSRSREVAAMFDAVIAEHDH